MNAQVHNRTWLGSVTAAIKALMGMLIDLINVANNGIAMADKAVVVAQEKQAIDLTISNKNYQKNALKLASMEQSKITEQVEEWIGKDEKRRKNVVDSYNDLEAAVEQELASIRAKRVQR